MLRSSSERFQWMKRVNTMKLGRGRGNHAGQVPGSSGSSRYAVVMAFEEVIQQREQVVREAFSVWTAVAALVLDQDTMQPP
jgi:hypothetical protein